MSDERPQPSHPLPPPQATLLDRSTARAVRVLCWSVSIAVWLYLLTILGILVALLVGVAASDRPA